jgi:hypothetical protein
VPDLTTPPVDAPTRGAGPRRVLAWVTVTALVAMWVYVLYLAFGPGRQAPPDRLDDPTFATQAQAICEAAHDDVDELPPAIEADDADQRADIVAEANARFGAMLDDIEELTPGGEDGDIVQEWLADWRTYLDDRAEYIAALREDPEARLFVTARDRDQVTEYMDAFAADNKMTACATPLDVS